MTIKRTAIILAGGKSRRVGYDKGLHVLAGKTLVERVVDSLVDSVQEILVVVSSMETRAKYIQVIGDEAKVIIDQADIGTPLIGLLTGLRQCCGEYAFVAGCDMPFIVPRVVELLFKSAEGSDGAVLLKPNGWIEPLHGVYNVTVCRAEADRLYRAGDLRIRMVFRNLLDVTMVPVDRVKTFDPGLLTLFDVDTEEKMKEALEILRNRS